MGIVIKNDNQISLMRVANKICAETHALLATHIKPGVTTGELDAIAEEFIRSRGATPSFKGYRGFPASICASINEEVIHGIPGTRRVAQGDILSIDIGVCYKHFHGDAARTHPVGSITDVHAKLIDVTEQSFWGCIKYAKAGYHLHELSAAIGDVIESNGFSIVQEWCGHGIGRQLHEDPQVPNARQVKRGPRLAKGMTLAIEPMVNEGVSAVHTLSDTWTVVTNDSKYSAHYENTILITDGEPEILSI